VNKLRVLVADDNGDMREVLVAILKRAFEVVATVDDGQALIDAALSSHPDVIVSDISMPMCSGPQAKRLLAARGRDIPFVFVSAGENIIGDLAPFVPKSLVFGKLVPAVHAAAASRAQYSPRIHFAAQAGC
jgi:CheY-like chemotaxis protein